MRGESDLRLGRRRAARLAAAALALFGAGEAGAQVATDGTVGARRTIAGPVISIGPELGARSGGNLFHSFQRFNVRSGQAALFGVPTDVTTVIGRVTGGQASLIDGPVSFVLPGTFTPTGADFWFFNPAGVMIGEGGEFRTNGSLHLSAGSAAIFADGATFSADAGAALSLTSAPPSAFALGAAPGTIRLTDADLSAEGDVLSLSGGRLIFDRSLVASPAGADIVVAAGGAGEIAPVGSFAAPQAAAGGEILITGAGEGLSAEATTLDGGDVRVSAGRLKLTDGAVIQTTSAGPANAGRVLVSAGDVAIRSGSRIRSQTASAGNAGDVTITGFERLFASRAGSGLVTGISSSSAPPDAPGDAPDGAPDDPPDVAPETGGDAGAVTIRGGDVILKDAARIVSNTFGEGDAARVDMRVRTLTGRGGSQIGSGALDNRDLATGAGGAAGEVSIVATEAIRFSGVRSDSPLPEPEPSGVFSGTEGARSGAGGQTTISAPLIVLSNEAEVGSETFNKSDAAGLTIRGGELRIRSGAEVTTTGRRAGDAGAIRIDLTGPLSVGNGAEIASRSRRGGAAGQIVISSSSMTLSGGGSITTDSASADGGSISLNSPGLIIANNARVTTSVGASTGDGGNVRVQSGLLVLGGGSRISATADQGDGGDVTLNAGTSFFDAAAAIEVGSRAGQNGTIVINGAVGTQSSETDPPPAEFLNRFALIDDFCVAAVTGGSALTLEAPRGADAEADPALFGAAIPYPGAPGAADASSEIDLAAVRLRAARCAAGSGR